jgi:hypothetical protein
LARICAFGSAVEAAEGKSPREIDGVTREAMPQL